MEFNCNFRLRHGQSAQCGAGDENRSARADVRITHEPEVVRARRAHHFARTGRHARCMALRAERFARRFERSAKNKPLLGVCVGEQMLFGHAEEGNSHGLGWFAGGGAVSWMMHAMKTVRRSKCRIWVEYGQTNAPTCALVKYPLIIRRLLLRAQLLRESFGGFDGQRIGVWCAIYLCGGA